MKKNIQSFRNKWTKDLDLKELIKGSAISFIMRLINMALNFLLLWIFAQYGGSSLVGLFSLSLVILNVSVLLANIGMDTGILKLSAKYNALHQAYQIKYLLKKSFIFTIPLSFLIGISIFLLSDLIATKLFNTPELSSFVKITAFGIPFMSILLICSESLRGLKKIMEYSLFNRGFYFFIASISIGFLFLLEYRNPMWPYIIFIVSIGISAIFCFYILNKNIQGSLNSVSETDISLESHKELLLLSLPMLLSSAFNFIQGWSDTIILGIFRSEEEVGIYNVAFRFTSLAQLSLLAVNSISAPKFSEFFSKGEYDKIGLTAKRASKITFLTSAPILLIFLLFPEFLLSLYGEAFTGGENVIRLISIGRFFNAINGAAGLVLLMTGNQRIFQNIVIGTSLISIILSLILIPMYGIDGAAIAHMCGLITYSLISLYYVKLKFGFLVVYFPFTKILNFIRR